MIWNPEHHASPEVKAAIREIDERTALADKLAAWRKRMPANWYGNADLDAAVLALRAAPGPHGPPLTAWKPIDDQTPRDWTSPILAWNSRQPTWPPVMVRWCVGDQKDGIDPYWCDAATQAGEALYYNPNYFDFWTTVALPRPQSEAPHE